MNPARSLSVTAAAAALKMHRSTVHRYLLRYPGLRNRNGKVSLARLIEAIEADKKAEPRGRSLAHRPRQGPRWRAKTAAYKVNIKFSIRMEDWTKEQALDWIYEYDRMGDWTRKLRAAFGI